jgi:aryl-alcohol dehydrogenase-like predicted oxidoreductase
MMLRPLGRSGLEVSSLGLGTMTFGRGDGFAGLRPKVDGGLAGRIVAAAVERGVTLFDSAGRYNDGTAEEVLGAAVRPYRAQVSISTKDPVLPATDGGPVIDQIRANVEASLRRLDVEVIDVYQVGVVRLDQPLDGIVDGLAAVVDAGWVRTVGVTNVPSWMLDRLAGSAAGDGRVRLVAAQMSYSLLDRHIEHDYRALLTEHGIGVLAWSPLAGGFLTGKYSRDDPEGAGGRLATIRLQPLDLERGFAVVDVLHEIAAGRQTTPSAVALAWVAAKPFVSSVLFGVTSMEDLASNLAAVDVLLADEEVSALDDASASPKPYPYWLYPDS